MHFSVDHMHDGCFAFGATFNVLALQPSKTLIEKLPCLASLRSIHCNPHSPCDVLMNLSEKKWFISYM